MSELNQYLAADLPSRESYDEWRNANKVTEFYHKFLATWIESTMAQYMTGELVDKKSMEEIAIENIRVQMRLAIFSELLNLKYDDITEMLGVITPDDYLLTA